MISTRNNNRLASTASRLARVVVTAAAATALGVIALPAPAYASSATAETTPLATQPTRATTPAPTSPSYVAPVLLRTADIISSAANDSQNDLTLTIKPGSQALADFAANPSSLVGRIVVTTPPGQKQMVAQVTSAARSDSAWTVATRRVSAMAALPPGDYPMQPDYTRARFTTTSGVTFYPTSTHSGAPAAASYTAELGPYTWKYSCGSGEVDLTGDLKLTPSIEADADIGWTSLNSASLKAGLKEQASLTLGTTGPDDTPTTCSKTVVLGSFTVPIDIGPLVATVSFKLKADIKASLEGRNSVSVVQSFDGEAGVQYDGDSWSLIDNATANTPDVQHDISGTADVEVGLTAEAGLSFYDVLSGKLDLRAFAGIKTQPAPNPLLDLYAGVTLKYQIDAFGYDVADGQIWGHEWDLFHTPVVNTLTLPGAHWYAGAVTPMTPPSYWQQLRADGGVGSLTFAKVSGTLPDGITLTSSGVLSGNPKSPVTTCADPCSPAPTPDKTFTFTVQVTDSKGLSGTRQLSMKVGTVLVTTSKLHDGYLGKSYTATLGASGVVGSATWQLVSGNLPPQLTLSEAGRITGQLPSQRSAARTYAFVVKVTDSTGYSATASESIAINSNA